MIRVLLSARIQKTATKLPDEVREKASQVIADVASAFGNLHRHSGLGLRKLSPGTYEARVHLQWRIIFIQEPNALIAYDVMNHDQVRAWLKGR